jgi:hypothetical protein
VAYIYPEQHFKSGEAMDPRDFNRNAGQYASEMSQLDRDNLQTASVTSAKLKDFVYTEHSSASPVKRSWIGPCNAFTVWQTGDTQTISDVEMSLIEIDQLGGTISTLDSVLVVELSMTLNATLDSVSTATVDHHHFQVYLEVDGIRIDTTGEVACFAAKNTVYLCGSVPVGAGDHSIKTRIRGWAYDPNTDVAEEFNGSIELQHRELFVREKRR